MFIVQAQYDAWCIAFIVGMVNCIENNKNPYSILDCNQTAKMAAEDYR